MIIEREKWYHCNNKVLSDVFLEEVSRQGVLFPVIGHKPNEHDYFNKCPNGIYYLVDKAEHFFWGKKIREDAIEYEMNEEILDEMINDLKKNLKELGYENRI